MFENIPIGILFISLIWILCTIYAIIRKDSDGIMLAFMMTVCYGIYKLIDLLIWWN